VATLGDDEEPELLNKLNQVDNRIDINKKVPLEVAVKKKRLQQFIKAK
jgi:hypothetical protein